MVPPRSGLSLCLGLGLLWLLSYEPAAPSRGTQPSVTQKKQKRSQSLHLYNVSNGKAPATLMSAQIRGLLRKACEGIASHPHRAMAAEFIWGSSQDFVSGAEIYLHNFHGLSNQLIHSMHFTGYLPCLGLCARHQGHRPEYIILLTVPLHSSPTYTNLTTQVSLLSQPFKQFLSSKSRNISKQSLHLKITSSV